MYILLNRENLVVSYKSADPEILCNLAWIELKEFAYTVGPCDSRSLKGMTQMELHMLYRNTTGKELPLSSYSIAVETVSELLKNMPETAINAFEADVQAGAIEEENRGCFKFVPGAKRPALVQEPVVTAYQCGEITSEQQKEIALALLAKQATAASKPRAGVSTNKPKQPTTWEAKPANPVQAEVFKQATLLAANFFEKTDSNFSSLKALVVEECSKINISSFTVSMQLNEWKKMFWM